MLGPAVIRRNIAILLSTSFIGWLAYGFMMWITPILIEKAGGVEAYAFLSSASRIIPIFLGVLGGIMADTMGRKPILVLSSLLLSIGFTVLYITNVSLIGLFVEMMLSSLAGCLVGPSFLALLNESADEKYRGRILSISSATTPLLVAAGSSAFGFIYQSGGLHLALALVVVMYYVELILNLMLKETKVGVDEATKTKRESIFSGAEKLISRLMESRQLLKRREMIALLSIIFFWNLGLGSMWSIYFSKVMGLDASLIGLAYSYNAIINFIGTLIGGWFIDKYGPIRGFLFEAIFSRLPTILFLSTMSTNKVVALFTLMSTPLFTYGNLAYLKYVPQAFGEKRQGIVFGAVDSFQAFVSVFAPIIAMSIWKINPTMIFVAYVIIGFIEIPFILMLRRQSEHAETI